MDPIIEAFPLVGLVLASTLVLLAAEVVKSATAWLKLRLRRRMTTMPHWLIHGISAALSLTVALLFLSDGRLAEDPVFGAFDWPWNALIFAVATFLRAGGRHDEGVEHSQVVNITVTDEAPA